MPRPDVEFSQNLDLLFQQVLRTQPIAPVVSNVPVTISQGVNAVASWVSIQPAALQFNGQMQANGAPHTLAVTVAGTIDMSADFGRQPGNWVAVAIREHFHLTLNYVGCRSCIYTHVNINSHAAALASCV